MSEVVAGTPAQARRGQWFFVLMGLVAVAVTLIGFAKTFIAPVATGAFEAPLVVYLHGGFAFAWVLVFAGQPWWIRLDQFRLHRIFGVAGVLAALGVAATAMPVAAFAVTRDLAAGGGEAAVSTILGVFTATLVFVGLVFGGVAMRGTPETHKRLMLLATIAVLWPAWFRLRHYFPDVPRPDIVFALVMADSLILVAALRDWLVLKRVHPVWLIGGSLLILEHTLEVVFFDSPLWRAAARVLYAPFAPG